MSAQKSVMFLFNVFCLTTFVFSDGFQLVRNLNDVITKENVNCSRFDAVEVGNLSCKCEETKLFMSLNDSSPRCMSADELGCRLQVMGDNAGFISVVPRKSYLIMIDTEGKCDTVNYRLERWQHGCRKGHWVDVSNYTKRTFTFNLEERKLSIGAINSKAEGNIWRLIVYCDSFSDCILLKAYGNTTHNKVCQREKALLMEEILLSSTFQTTPIMNSSTTVNQSTTAIPPYLRKSSNLVLFVVIVSIMLVFSGAMFLLFCKRKIKPTVTPATNTQTGN